MGCVHHWGWCVSEAQRGGCGQWVPRGWGSVCGASDWGPGVSRGAAVRQERRSRSVVVASRTSRGGEKTEIQKSRAWKSAE
eukprot:scaffold54004_cov30-Phaeocystis_antarctica.AAC.1